MKKFLIAVMLVGLLSPATNGQLWKVRRLEISAGAGTTQFYGDIGGYSNNKNILGIRDFTFKHTRVDINTNVRYRLDEDFSARINLMFGIFHSTDARGSNISRGFETSSLFFEPSVIGEYYFIKSKGDNSFLFLKGKKSIFRSFFESLDFYVFGGFGIITYKVTPNDVLAPFVTRTSSLTGVVPMGLGVSMIYSGNFNFGLELSGRLTNSDNIDGFTSVRSRANDIYHLMNFTVSYKINTGKNGLPRFGK